jgi:hypothetical protein
MVGEAAVVMRAIAPGEAALGGWSEEGREEAPCDRHDHCIGEDIVCSSHTSESHWPAPKPPNIKISCSATAQAAWAYLEQGTTGGK